MTKLLNTTLALLALCLAACTVDQTGAHFTGMNSGDKPSWFCQQPENTAKCILGGFLTAGIITGIIVHNHHHNSSCGGGGGGGPSPAIACGPT